MQTSGRVGRSNLKSVSKAAGCQIEREKSSRIPDLQTSGGKKLALAAESARFRRRRTRGRTILPAHIALQKKTRMVHTPGVETKTRKRFASPTCGDSCIGHTMDLLAAVTAIRQENG